MKLKLFFTFIFLFLVLKNVNAMLLDEEFFETLNEKAALVNLHYQLFYSPHSDAEIFNENSQQQQSCRKNISKYYENYTYKHFWIIADYRDSNKPKIDLYHLMCSQWWPKDPDKDKFPPFTVLWEISPSYSSNKIYGEGPNLITKNYLPSLEIFINSLSGQSIGETLVPFQNFFSSKKQLKNAVQAPSEVYFFKFFDAATREKLRYMRIPIIDEQGTPLMGPEPPNKLSLWDCIIQ